MSEGDDCVGHQLNWNTRLGVIERLDAIGVGEITMPSHVTFSEERDRRSDRRKHRLHEAKPSPRRAVDGRLDALAGRHRVPFFKAMADAGADGVYVVDSRGNSTPLATRVFIGRIRKAVGERCDVYIQHHNDLGVATANAMAAAEGGANWIDASVIGIGDRGGCVALEEAAALFEMYGIDTGIKLDKLYELCRYVQVRPDDRFPGRKLDSISVLPAKIDLVAGRVQMFFTGTPPVLSEIRNGTLRAVGVTTAKRTNTLPEVPTIAESGVKGFDVSPWFGVLAPAKTPPAIVTRLNEEIVKVLRNSTLRERLARDGVKAVGNSPKEFGGFIRVEMDKWSKAVKESGAKVE